MESVYYTTPNAAESVLSCGGARLIENNENGTFNGGEANVANGLAESNKKMRSELQSSTTLESIPDTGALTNSPELSQNEHTSLEQDPADVLPTSSNDANTKSCVLHIRRLPPGIYEDNVAILAAPFGQIKNMVLTKLTGQALIEMKDEEGAVAMHDFYNNTCPPIVKVQAPLASQSGPGLNYNRGQKPMCMPTALGNLIGPTQNRICIQYSRYQSLKTKVISQQVQNAINNANMQSFYDYLHKKHVLRISIKDCPNTIKLGHVLFYKIFHIFGTIEKIIVFKVNSVMPQAFVQFSNHYSAAVAKNAINGRQLSYCGGYIYVDHSSQDEIQVRKSNGFNRDYLEEPFNSADEYMMEFIVKTLGDPPNGLYNNLAQENIMDPASFIQANGNPLLLGNRAHHNVPNSFSALSGVGPTSPMVNLKDLYCQLFSMQTFLQERLKCGDKFSADQAKSYVAILAETLSRALNVQNHGKFDQSLANDVSLLSSKMKNLDPKTSTAMKESLSRIFSDNTTFEKAFNQTKAPDHFYPSGEMNGNKGLLHTVSQAQTLSQQQGSTTTRSINNNNSSSNNTFSNFPLNLSSIVSGNQFVANPDMAQQGHVKSPNFIPRYYVPNEVKKSHLNNVFMQQKGNSGGYNYKTLLVPFNASPVIIVSHLNPEKVDPDILFTLFGVYGDVIRVKIMYSKRDTALVQFADSFQAAVAIENLNGQVLYGRKMLCNISKYYQIKLPSQTLLMQKNSGKTPDELPISQTPIPDSNAEAVDPDKAVPMLDESEAGDGGHEGQSAEEQMQLALSLTKDYLDSPLHRYKKANSRNFSNIFPPSLVLHVSNLPCEISLEEVANAFTAKGHVVVKSKLMMNERRMALLQFESVELAIIALIEMHDYPIKEGQRIRVCFSRSHITNNKLEQSTLETEDPLMASSGDNNQDKPLHLEGNHNSEETPDSIESTALVEKEEGEKHLSKQSKTVADCNEMFNVFFDKHIKDLL